MKFAITPAQRESLMAQLAPHLRADENACVGARYPIVSLYYDNAERDCYWEKARSVPSRRKLRVRVYGSRDGAVPASAFVEIKHKCEGRGVKRRVPLPLAQALRVCEGFSPEGVTLSNAERRIIAEVHDLVFRRKFRPVIVMRYERTAFAARDLESDLRITFDEEIRARFNHLRPEPDDRRFEPREEISRNGAVVLEVKVTGCIPYWLSRTLAAAGCRLQSHSKYSTALEASDPVLPAMFAPGWRPPLSVVAEKDAAGNFRALAPVSTTAFAPVGN